MKKPDIAQSGSELSHLRTSVSRFLVEFQKDLSALDEAGLEPPICLEVQGFLKKAISEFDNRTDKKELLSVYRELAKLFRKYLEVYIAWNGHEGTDPGIVAGRQRAIAPIKEGRRKLIRKISSRQAEMVVTPQFNLDFVVSVRTPLHDLAERYPIIFPRLKQASIAWR